MPRLLTPSVAGGGQDGSEGYLKRAQVYFQVNGQLRAFETRYYARHGLKAGSVIAGPAVLFQKDSTTVVPPHWTARVAATGNLFLHNAEA
jgi:N-methylhydantoinase A